MLVGDNHLLAKLRCPDFQPIASRIRQRLAMTRAEPKFPLSGDDRQDLLDDCLSFCGTVAVPEPPSRAPECRDPCDRKFLELALAGQADALMTGDGDLLALAEEFCVPMLIDAVQSDSAEFVRGLNEAPIDEIQRASELLLAIKKAVVEDYRPGRLPLTGSANVMTLPGSARCRLPSPSRTPISARSASRPGWASA